jgi:hypothetical protein
MSSITLTGQHNHIGGVMDSVINLVLERQLVPYMNLVLIYEPMFIQEISSNYSNFKPFSAYQIHLDLV